METIKGHKPKALPREIREKTELQLLAERIVNLLPVATKDNNWEAMEVNSDNIQAFRVALSRYAKSFNIAAGENRRFKVEMKEEGNYKEYLVWRME